MIEVVTRNCAVTIHSLYGRWTSNLRGKNTLRCQPVCTCDFLTRVCMSSKVCVYVLVKSCRRSHGYLNLDIILW